MMLRDLAAVAANYRDAGINRFVLAYFVRDLETLRGSEKLSACRFEWSDCPCR